MGPFFLGHLCGCCWVLQGCHDLCGHGFPHVILGKASCRSDFVRVGFSFFSEFFHFLGLVSIHGQPDSQGFLGFPGFISGQRNSAFLVRLADRDFSRAVLRSGVSPLIVSGIPDVVNQVPKRLLWFDAPAGDSQAAFPAVNGFLEVLKIFRGTGVQIWRCHNQIAVIHKCEAAHVDLSCSEGSPKKGGKPLGVHDAQQHSTDGQPYDGSHSVALHHPLDGA